MNDIESATRSADDLHPVSGRFSFWEVFRDELRAVKARRQANDPLRGNQNDKMDVEALLETKEADGSLRTDQRKAELLQESALKRDLCGLAISGGGIRSATFALGVLQALALTGLLRRFDYLSTVSGGGYIGSWLTAGIQRHGFGRMEEQLMPARIRAQATPAESDDDPGIRHLRLYSNYLAPRPGIFTVDGWLLIAIFLRNLLLNQIVLLLAAVGLVLGIRGVVELFGNLKWNSLLNHVAIPVGMIGASVIALVYVFGQMKLSLVDPGLDRRAGHSRQFGGIPFYLVLYLLIAASLFLGAMIHLAAHSWPASPGWLVPLNILGFAWLGLLAIVPPPQRRGSSDEMKVRACGVLSGACAGALSGMFFWSIAQIPAETPGGMLAVWATLGVPVLILAGVVANFLYVGGAGKRLADHEREYWSLFNARCMMMAIIWLFLFSFPIFAPIVLMTAFNGDWNWLNTILGSGWVATLATFLWAAFTEKTGSGSTKGVRELMARLAPFAFLLTLFALIVTFGVWLAYDVYARWLARSGITVRTFLESVPYLLTDLDQSKYAGPAIVYNFLSVVLYFGGVAISLVLANLLGRAVGVNRFSLHELYKNRLVRCYLGATNTQRTPNQDTDFDFNDDMAMSSLLPTNTPEQTDAQRIRQARHWGPIPIINFALNQRSTVASVDSTSTKPAESPLSFVERKARPFFCTPQYSGSEATAWCQTKTFADDISIGTAMAISGAAVSPNMGYHSSPLTTMLLTIFNLRLGAWLGHPGRKDFRNVANPPASLKLMLNELAGKTGADADFVYLSDGGHFENTGIYELVRRRCRFIVVVDSGSDPQIHENIGRAVRMVRIDFGVNIDLDMGPVTPDNNGLAASHVAIGRIHYSQRHEPDMSGGAPDKAPNGDRPESDGQPQDYADPSYRYQDNQGIIVWIKNAMTGKETADLKNFQKMNVEFPFDPTANQFFGESRFESYRALGFHSIFRMLENISFRKPYTTNGANGVAASETSRYGPRRARFSAAFSQKTRQQTASHEDRRLRAAAAADVPNNDSRPGLSLFFDQHPVRTIFEDIFDYWLAKPKQFSIEYMRQNEVYISILDKLRTSPELSNLANELYGTADQKQQARQIASDSEHQIAERLIVGEMMTLLENVWFSLDLERNRLHPVHAGWLQVFEHWINSPRVWSNWQDQAREPEYDETKKRFPETLQHDGLMHEFSPVFREFVNDVYWW